MNHIWSVICQRSSIDMESNLISLFDCLEQIDVKIDKSNLPVNLPISLQIINYWIVDDADKGNEFLLKIEQISPTGATLQDNQVTLSVPTQALRYRSRTNIIGLSITESGRYFFKVSQKHTQDKEFKVIAQLPLDINIVAEK